MTEKPVRVQWTSRMAFILAASGSAIGLGNIWKFPYIAGENGGGAFVLIYLACVAAIGVPIMMAEILLGKRGRLSPINTMLILAGEIGATPAWRYVGWLGVIAGFLILSYYSVIAGWTMAYVLKMSLGSFVGISAIAAGEVFSAFKSTPQFLLIWHTVFMAVTLWIVSLGVSGGLEKGTRFMMPALFILLLLLVGYAMNSGAFRQGFEFLFAPDFSRLGADSVLIAMGQAFFSLSLGMGAIMVYGSYLPTHVSIARSTLWIAVADTVIALLAGMAIFPIIFANQLEPTLGPGLIFQTLPVAFGQMPAGAFFGTLFFVLLFFAALSSSISLIEPAVAWLSETWKMSRFRACAIAGSLCWLAGLGTVYSFNVWGEIKWFGKTIFELVDFVTANIMLPIGGVLMALFAGWVMNRQTVEAQLPLGKGLAQRAWWILIRYIAPASVFVVFLHASGIL